MEVRHPRKEEGVWGPKQTQYKTHDSPSTHVRRHKQKRKFFPWVENLSPKQQTPSPSSHPAILIPPSPRDTHVHPPSFPLTTFVHATPFHLFLPTFSLRKTRVERERERERGREGGLIWRRKESRCTHTIGYPVAANLLRRHRPRRFVLPASAAPSRGGLPLASSPVGPSPNVLLGSSYRYSSVARGFSSSLPSSTSPACCFTWVPSPSTSFPSSSTARLPALSTGARRFTPSSAPKWILIIRPAIRSVLGPILVFFFWQKF